MEGNLSGGTTGGGGLFLKGNWEENAFGFAYLDVFNGTASLPVIDPRLQIIAGKVFNGSVVALDGLEGRQIAFSYARSILEKTASVGPSSMMSPRYMTMTRRHMYLTTARS